MTDGTSALFSTSGVIDALCVDEGNNFFYLSDGSLYRYDGQAHTVIESGFSNELLFPIVPVKNTILPITDKIKSQNIAQPPIFNRFLSYETDGLYYVKISAIMSDIIIMLDIEPL